ncbi:MAG: alpha/beta hydrolase, partial [Clostridia bacterium]|nr:alpha/beta hydrolase [Clostridia bacterium]
MEKKKNRKGLIIAGSIIGSLLLLLFVLFFVLTTHTQIVVGLIQKATYGNKPFNSYEPYYEPINGLKENGQYLISEIKYDTEYPNSYLDIIYPNGDLTADRPTLIYFHGGGF